MELTTNGFPIRDTLGPVIGPLIAQYHSDARERVYTPEVVTFSLITGILSGDCSLQSCVIRNNTDRRLRNLAPASPNTAAFSQMRSKLDSKILSEGTVQMARDAEMFVKPDELWMGYTPYVIDGTTFTAADTPENQESFPQHGNQSDGAGFPMLRAVAIQSLTTCMILDIAYGPCKGKETGEMALARPLIAGLKGKSILIGDRYYPSFFNLAFFKMNGIEGVFQAHGARNIDFRSGKSIGVLDHIAVWPKPSRPDWMTEQEYDSYPSSIEVRECEITREVGACERFVLVTTLLDSAKVTKTRLAKMYKKRWRIEMVFKDLKDLFGLDFISAKTPDMVGKMIWAHCLAYNCLRWHILNASCLFHVPVENISPKGAATIIIQNQPIVLRTDSEHIPALFADIYHEMIRIKVGNRPGRVEPRAVKRRPKNFPRLCKHRSKYKKTTRA